jgi:putative hemolysin
MPEKHGFHIRKLFPLSEAVLKPGSLPLKNFKPKIKLNIERDRFIIKTAENHDELAKALRLRYEVFYLELLEKRLLVGIDIDKFDFKCDHLIIIDKKTDNFIGTYRLISSLFVKKFYSATEFKLDNILDLPGIKLELGRACVHKDYRTGSSIALLWRGITEYMKETGTQFLFGCSSVKVTDKSEIAAMYKHLSRNHLAPPQYRVYPKGKFKIRQFEELVEKVTPEEEAKAAENIPALIKSYLKMGAHICGMPAYDKKFKCADFLTLFNIDTSSEKMQKKYKL